MSDWLAEHLPDKDWAPRGLPRWLRPLPGWAARTASESRFPLEVAQWDVSALHGSRAASRGLPDGARRPVLVIPGFGFGDVTTSPLQWALRAGGYTVVPSGIVANVRCSDRAVNSLARVAARAVERDNGRRLLVVGHSRGGMLARGLGARHPELVSKVVALGAPLNHEFAFYEIPRPFVAALRVVHQTDPELREKRCATPECSCAYMRATRRPMPPDVDLVSLYTKSDGIVDWRACVVPGATNIEVTGSHLGMGLKPATLRTVMEQLAAPAAAA